MNKPDLTCQCHTCNKVFSYSDLNQDISKRHISPCCQASYSVLDPKLDKFFDRYLDVNNDKRYYA